MHVSGLTKTTTVFRAAGVQQGHAVTCDEMYWFIFLNISTSVKVNDDNGRLQLQRLSAENSITAEVKQ